MSDTPASPSTATPTRHVGVVVLPGFSLLAEACATEPLAVANQLAGRPLYRLTTFGLDGEPVASGSRQVLLTRQRVGDDVGLDMLMVCASDPE
ncbi:MAG: GlxA family transcriptional regulator, partial [Halomonas campaniensis]